MEVTKSLFQQQLHYLNKSRCKAVITAFDESFNPMINIVGPNHSVILNVEEFSKLIGEEGVLLNYFNTGDETWTPVKYDGLELQFQVISGNRVIKMIDGRQNVLYLAQKSFEELYALKPLIYYRLDLLKQQNFQSFYFDVLRGTVRINGDVEQYIKAKLSSMVKNINALSMLEVLHVLPNKIRTDLNQLRQY